MASIAMEEFELMKDKNYRAYVAEVDKALKSFETNVIYSDIVSSLDKLNRVLNNYKNKFPVIPRRMNISKRLAQCMLSKTSGVHFKVLETYDSIFKIMGTGRLSQELFIYSVGIFPFFASLGVNVQPKMLEVYKNHFVPLGPRLLPGLPGFLNGVLPGLEEGSDSFEGTNDLLVKVCDGVEPTAFYRCLWQIVADNAAIRLPALTFVNTHMNKKLSMDQQSHFLGNNTEVVVKALCAGVQDNDVLVQRLSLDIIQYGFPMHGTQLGATDMVRLVTASLSVILRGDMPLNRRLFAWLLGNEVNTSDYPSNHPLIRRLAKSPDTNKSRVYFELYSKDNLIKGFKETLKEVTSEIRPYRILSSLLNREDVGPVIIDDVLFDFLRLLYFTWQTDDESAKRKGEVIKSASSVISWHYIGSLFDQSCRMTLDKDKSQPEKVRVKKVGSGVPDIWEVCELTQFILKVIPVKIEQLMNLLLRLVALLTKHLDSLSHNQLFDSLSVCQTILTKIHPQEQPKSDATAESEAVRPALIRDGIGKDRPSLQTNEQTTSDFPTPQKGKNIEMEKMMGVFLKDFQSFFVALVSGGRIINNMCVPPAFEKLKKASNGTENYAEELRKLLNTVITENRPSKLGSEKLEKQSELNDIQLVVPGNEAWSDCFRVACEILVDIAKFPSSRENNSSLEQKLSPCLKTLLVCCCYLDSSPTLQLTAIHTLLDLHADHDDKCPAFIAPCHTLYIQRKTNVVRVVTEILWRHLGELLPKKQLMCIQLLHQLLNTFTLDDAVERTLGEALLRGDEASRVDALLRFIKLWTIGRELQDGRHKRHFQMCLLKILDNLLLPDHSPLKQQTQTWLSQSLMRGDITRLLDPLLLILLDPATARMGIRHVSIEPSAADLVPEELPLEDTSKIYAISSVDGNVIFHVSDVPPKDKNGFVKRIKRQRKKEIQTDKHVFAVTSLKGSPDSQLRYITEKNVARGIEIPRPSHGEVSLFVNPLNARYEEEAESESPSHVPEAVKNAKRLNSDNVRISPECYFRKIDEFDESELEDEASRTKYEGKRIVTSILNNVIDSIVWKVNVFNPSETAGVGVHPLHSHLLLYCDIYDSTRTLYAFNGLRNILSANPRLFLWCAATSGTVSASFPSDLLVLLARHQKCVFGRGFEGSNDSINEYIPAFRSTMYLEVLVIVCLYHACSFYPNLGHRLTPEILAENRLVQLTSIELLTDVFTELLPLIRENGKNFANYIRTNILLHSEVQSKVLHCVMSSLSSIQQRQQRQSHRYSSRTFTEEIVEFNDETNGNSLTEHSRALQMHLLKLTLALIKLEHHVEGFKSDSSQAGISPESSMSYSPEYAIPRQPLFLRAVGSALSIKGSMRELHCHWTSLVTSSLPYLGNALKDIIWIVINQLCVNVEELADVYANRSSGEELPPDYAIMQMEALTLLCHYCLLDSFQQVSTLALPIGENSSSQSGLSTHPGQILSNLVHVFTPLQLMQELGTDRYQHQEILAEVRRLMPRIITSLASVWTAITNNWINDEIKIWGSPKVIRNQILEFFSPLSINHGPCFITAIAVVWHERKDKKSNNVIPTPTPEQKVLVGMLGSIKVLPIDTLVKTVHAVLKQPLPIEVSLKDKVSVLELFYTYMQTSTPAQLVECWPSLLALLKDGELLPPSALFLVLAILNEFVQSAPPFSERKDQRDLQDITFKLVEECSKVAGACLEQSSFWLQKTWLKSTSVRDFDSIDEETQGGEVITLLAQSAQAQLVLAQILAPLLDVTYGSQDKDKAANLLLTVMSNVVPYLRNHQSRYAKCFRACSQLLANISGYNYMRKAWKREAFDLLLDPSLFQMEAECLPHWAIIVDHLMIHDQTTFGDLLKRILTSQSGLFSSREQEYEQRAHLLKRLAFVLMSSQTDQYTKSILSICDCLSESLRLQQVGPSIQAQVFFCFRVLLLRISPQNITTLWPIIISEMVQVFTHIELELTNETEEFSSYIKMMSGLDSSFVTNSNNGLHAHGHPHWLHLVLAACKLLDLAIILPASVLPQFQMCLWAFVGEDQGHGKLTTSSQDFVPHVKRISDLMDKKFGPLPLTVRAKEGRLILTKNNIESLKELHLFFHALNSRPKSDSVNLQEVEKHIFMDFLELDSRSSYH